MKKILLVFLFLFIFSPLALAKINYDVKLPLKGATKANLKLQSDTLMAVYTSASIKMPYCNKLSIYDTAIIKQPKNLKKEGDKYVSGNWTEQWAVKACGQNVYVPVNFVIDENGASYFIENSKVHF